MVAGWAQVALMMWMACSAGHQLPIQSSHGPYGEYIADGSSMDRLPKEALSKSEGRAERARASQFEEVAVTVSGQRNWFVHGPDLNGTYGGMQGTGGVEAVYSPANGYTCSILNDVYGNSVFDFVTYGGNYQIHWNPVLCSAYGPIYSTAPTPVNGVYIFGVFLNYRGHFVDGIGSYHFGENDYGYQSGTWQKPDPFGHAVNPGLYLAFNGDPVNQFDPTGRFSVGALKGSVRALRQNLPGKRICLSKTL